MELNCDFISKFLQLQQLQNACNWQLIN